MIELVIKMEYLTMSHIPKAKYSNEKQNGIKEKPNLTKVRANKTEQPQKQKQQDINVNICSRAYKGRSRQNSMNFTE